MLTFTIFPNLKANYNPYIRDFVDALNRQEGVTVINPAHKNPLLSILKKKYWGDIFVFNWFESIPDFKYGLLQSLIAIALITCLKWNGRKIVWMLHNKQPHVQRYGFMKRFLASLIANSSDIIVTHAMDGIEIVKERYPNAVGKVHFFHHPTKNRLECIRQGSSEKVYDLLIWGGISKYKGVTEYVDYLRRHPEEKLRVCILGKCSSTELFNELTARLPENITLIHDKVSFETLGEYIGKSHFVLAPYFSKSVLSSGILMDSLSYGAKIIGPHTGSFKDYAREPLINVYTFQDFSDIYNIVNQQKDTPISLTGYQRFLEENNWQAFVQSFVRLNLA